MGNLLLAEVIGDADPELANELADLAMRKR